MKSQRIKYRKRTKELMEKLLTMSVTDQMEFLGHDDEVDTQAEIEKTKKSLTKIDQIEWFDLIEISSNIVIGSCGFHNWVKEHRRAEIGYFLHPQFRKQGLMTEATKQVIDYGFNSMNLIRIEAWVDPDNKDSIAIMKRFGFTKEGVLRSHYLTKDKVYDSVIYSLLVGEFHPQAQ